LSNQAFELSRDEEMREEPGEEQKFLPVSGKDGITESQKVSGGGMFA
jgi:hypothetical protein